MLKFCVLLVLVILICIPTYKHKTQIQIQYSICFCRYHNRYTPSGFRQASTLTLGPVYSPVITQSFRACWRHGCIICSILPSGMGARGVSSEHVENMELFFSSPTLVRSYSQRTLSDIHCMFV